MKLLKLVLMAGAAAVALSSAASAADLPTRKAPPAPYVPVAAPFSWTGFYVGATAGANWDAGYSHFSVFNGGAPLGSGYIPGSLGSGSVGFQGGGEVGYNYQIGSAVLGIEDDIEYLSNSKSLSYTGSFLPAPVGGALSTTVASRLDWLGTTRGRLGFTPTPDQHLLLFVTGGLAYGGGNSSVSATDGPYSWYGSNSATQLGWTIGAGAEYAFTNNWTVKAEYLYYDLGSYNYSTTPAGPAAASNIVFNAKVHPEGNIARLGINYKF